MPSKYCVREVDIGAHARDITALWSRCLRSLSPQAAAVRLKHRYLLNPAGPGSALLLQQDDADTPEVAGVQCLHARTFHHQGRTWQVAGMADYAVAEQHRTLGPALQLMKQALAAGRAHYDWLYGLPNTKSEAVCKRSGLVYLGSAGRWTALLRSRLLCRRWLPGPLAAVLAPVLDLGLLLRDALGLGAARGQHWHDSAGSPAEIDAIWQQRPPELLLSERSRAVLSWRFGGDAAVPWTVSVARRRNGSLLGYVVWRVEAGVAQVADFLSTAPLRDTALLMRGFAWHLRRQRGVQRVTLEFFGSHDVAQALRSAGFWARPESLPLYLAAGQHEAPAADRWYFTAFDRDGD